MYYLKIITIYNSTLLVHSIIMYTIHHKRHQWPKDFPALVSCDTTASHMIIPCRIRKRYTLFCLRESRKC